MSAERVIANLLRIAREDLEGARMLNARGNRNAIYLCEQAAEKIMRAVLTYARLEQFTDPLMRRRSPHHHAHRRPRRTTSPRARPAHARWPLLDRALPRAVEPHRRHRRSGHGFKFALILGEFRLVAEQLA